MSIFNLYIALILSGVLLITLEIFLPGGIVGLVGFLLIVAAAGVALTAGETLGVLLGILALVIGGGLFAFVISMLPKTRFGKKLVIDDDMRDSKIENADVAGLVGKEGTAETLLRPAGFAKIDNRRIDVITRGEIVDQGARIRVVDVEGTRVIVEQL